MNKRIAVLKGGVNKTSNKAKEYDQKVIKKYKKEARNGRRPTN